jgi:polyphosphate kinase
MAIDASHPTPAFRNRALYLGAILRRRAVRGPNRLFGVVEVPAQASRLVPLGGAGPMRVVLLEETIGARLARLFGGYEVTDWTTFRLTRGCRLRELLQAVHRDGRPVQARILAPRRADVVRLEVGRGVSPPLLRCLAKLQRTRFPLDRLDPYNAVYVIPGPVDLGNLLNLVQVSDALTR